MTHSRLGSWSPSTLEERVDRTESLAAIRQLAMRYGMAVDSPDLDMRSICSPGRARGA